MCARLRWNGPRGYMKSKIVIGDWVMTTINSYYGALTLAPDNTVNFYEVFDITLKLDGGTFYDCVNLVNGDIDTLRDHNYSYNITKVPKGNVQALQTLYGNKVTNEK